MKEVRRLAEYVTLIEAAELEGVKYKTMAQRLNRNPDKFDTMTEKSENGGKDAVLVAVASLSKKAILHRITSFFCHIFTLFQSVLILFLNTKIMKKLRVPFSLFNLFHTFSAFSLRLH